LSEAKKFYSIPKAAEMCGVSRTAMWKWVKSGEVRALVTPGGHHRILHAEIERVLEKAGQGANAGPRRKSILIVDDDAALLKLLQRRFEKAGYRTEIAASGFEAGFKLSQSVPDLVLLDLYMPGMDGFEVCRMIKQNNALGATRVVILTSFNTPENEARVMELGADAFLPKSMTPGRLVSCLGRMIDGSGESK